ncbi:MAG: prolyl oligopeptidase family serine peptidase [Bacteroidota bacterium]
MKVSFTLILLLAVTGLSYAQTAAPMMRSRTLKNRSPTWVFRWTVCEKQTMIFSGIIKSETLRGWIRWPSPGLPGITTRIPQAQGASNPLVFRAYIFIPKTTDISKKYPLLVYSHGGVHGDLDSFSGHIIRELMSQDTSWSHPIIAAAQVYGRDFYEAIDYGGKEVVDANTARDYVVENYSFVDKERVGIMGWSHGGMITLLDIFNNPDEYKVAYAGVPVSDLIARMGYKSQGYRDQFSADYHIGKTAEENVQEYRKRSPYGMFRS